MKTILSLKKQTVDVLQSMNHFGGAGTDVIVSAFCIKTEQLCIGTEDCLSMGELKCRHTDRCVQLTTDCWSAGNTCPLTVACATNGADFCIYTENDCLAKD